MVVLLVDCRLPKLTRCQAALRPAVDNVDMAVHKKAQDSALARGREARTRTPRPARNN